MNQTIDFTLYSLCQEEVRYEQVKNTVWSFLVARLGTVSKRCVDGKGVAWLCTPGQSGLNQATAQVQRGNAENAQSASCKHPRADERRL